jgi:hypothetical protein
MPCYDPTSPYSWREKESATSAARILCEFVGDCVAAADGSLSREMLEWFIEHRLIDLAECDYWHKPDNEKRSAEFDINAARNLLTDMEKSK